MALSAGLVRELDLSQARVSQLIHAKRIHAVRTRIGWRVDPESVAAYAAEREVRPPHPPTRPARGS